MMPQAVVFMASSARNLSAGEDPVQASPLHSSAEEQRVNVAAWLHDRLSKWIDRCVDIPPREAAGSEPVISRRSDLSPVGAGSALPPTALPSRADRPDRFYLFNGITSVPFGDFLQAMQELLDHCGFHRKVLGMAAMYILRIDRQRLKVTWKNINRLLLASLLLAIKYWEDDNMSNRQYAALVGLELRDINDLESLFLRLIDYRLYIDMA